MNVWTRNDGKQTSKPSKAKAGAKRKQANTSVKSSRKQANTSVKSSRKQANTSVKSSRKQVEMKLSRTTQYTQSTQSTTHKPVKRIRQSDTKGAQRRAGVDPPPSVNPPLRVKPPLPPTPSNPRYSQSFLKQPLPPLPQLQQVKSPYEQLLSRLQQCWVSSSSTSMKHIVCRIDSNIRTASYDLYTVYIYTVPEWDPVQSYDTDTIVIYKNKLWKTINRNYLFALNEPSTRKIVNAAPPDNAQQIWMPVSMINGDVLPLCKNNVPANGSLIVTRDVDNVVWDPSNPSNPNSLVSSPFIYGSVKCNAVRYVVLNSIFLKHGTNGAVSLTTVLHDQRMFALQYEAFYTWITQMHQNQYFIRSWDDLASDLLWDELNQQWRLFDWTFVYAYEFPEEIPDPDADPNGLIDERNAELQQALVSSKLWSFPFCKSNPWETRSDHSLLEFVQPFSSKESYTVLRSFNWYTLETLLTLSDARHGLYIVNPISMNHAEFDQFTPSASNAGRHPSYIRARLIPTFPCVVLINTRQQEVQTSRVQESQSMIPLRQSVQSNDMSLDLTRPIAFIDLFGAYFPTVVDGTKLQQQQQQGENKWLWPADSTVFPDQAIHSDNDSFWQTVLRRPIVNGEIEIGSLTEYTFNTILPSTYIVLLPQMSYLNHNVVKNRLYTQVFGNEERWINVRDQILFMEPIVPIATFLTQWSWFTERLDEIKLVIHVLYASTNFYMLVVDANTNVYVLWSFSLPIGVGSINATNASTLEFAASFYTNDSIEQYKRASTFLSTQYASILNALNVPSRNVTLLVHDGGFGYHLLRDLQLTDAKTVPYSAYDLAFATQQFATLVPQRKIYIL